MCKEWLSSTCIAQCGQSTIQEAHWITTQGYRRSMKAARILRMGCWFTITECYGHPHDIKSDGLQDGTVPFKSQWCVMLMGKLLFRSGPEMMAEFHFSYGATLMTERYKKMKWGVWRMGGAVNLISVRWHHQCQAIRNCAPSKRNCKWQHNFPSLAYHTNGKLLLRRRINCNLRPISQCIICRVKSSGMVFPLTLIFQVMTAFHLQGVPCWRTVTYRRCTSENKWLGSALAINAPARWMIDPTITTEDTNPD